MANVGGVDVEGWCIESGGEMTCPSNRVIGNVSTLTLTLTLALVADDNVEEEEEEDDDDNTPSCSEECRALFRNAFSI